MIILSSQALDQALLQAYLIEKIRSIKMISWIMERKDLEPLVFLFQLLCLLKWTKDNVVASFKNRKVPVP